MGKQRIAVLGMGTVGSGLIQSYEMNKQAIDARLGCELEFTQVLVRDAGKDRGLPLDQSVYTQSFEEIELDKVDIVIELMGGVDPAFDYIKRALQSGCNVVTANKELMAKRGTELIQVAKDNKALIRYEASVGGGIPLISTMNDALASNQIRKLMGILNGTTNYILTKMTKEKASFEDVLKKAQDLGFAEADPTADVDGFDAAYKLAILSKDAFGIAADPEEIAKEGIRKISLADIEYGLELGYKIKLLALGERSNEHVELSVQPTLIPVDHPIASVNNEYNALYLEGNVVGKIMLYGKGAGALPTGSAVLSDLIDLIKKGHDYIGSYKVDNIPVNNIGKSPYYVRMEVVDRPGVLGKIAVAFGKEGISLDSVVQRARNGQFAPLVFITHEIERKALDKALDAIQRDGDVREILSIIKVVK